MECDRRQIVPMSSLKLTDSTNVKPSGFPDCLPDDIQINLNPGRGTQFRRLWEPLRLCVKQNLRNTNFVGRV